ncbi:DUF350 domain-containing protein [Chitinilyticum piscinae]|uniref:DUF350 domain-containing protein n=1 Tax=Chitinilyticum piscinae TaxID=2866724 RepID=A0A8J7G0Q9_9NEIS|nr:DUF350 domain-containing protein [Chitinilyticum piscinae]MBE9609233.1 DUF350 domain-containing protein [Chitinilyticum piscinae]
MLDTYLPLLLTYLTYLGSGIALLVVFSVIYAWVTPIDELKLIREGCTAAALSYGGALIGFSLTIASSAWHVNKLEYFLMWGGLAMIAQIVVHIVLGRCVKGMAQALIENNIAVGAFAGSVSLAVGIINAGSLS